MKLWHACTLLLPLIAAAPATAQAPFDMSTETPASSTAQPPTTPPSPAVQPAGTQPSGAAAATPSAGPHRRFLLPFANFVLSGEFSRRSWGVYLTPQEAASAAALTLAYRNAIVVAPEASRLRLSINGTRLVDAPVASAEKTTELAADIQPGLLHPGLNEITVEVEQRHRTDCTIQSTYELWAELDPARTFLTFQDAGAGRWKGIEDLRAIGVDDSGRTRFNLVVPSLRQSAATAPVVRLAEALAILADMPNQSFELRDAPEAGNAGPGRATVVMGPAAELDGLLSALPPGAETAPTVAVTDDPRTGPSTLVMTGPNWQAVGSAVNEIAAQFDLPVGSQRTSLSTQTWRMPDVPMFFGAGRAKLSALGVPTQEFSGRRLRVDFSVGIPSDFFADAYGDFELLLDAAYSEEVQPGSHIDIYVNDHIAATVPVTTDRGEILRHLPISVTMRHFRPGDNTIAIEAVLLTAADAVCTPGAAASPKSRFVLFDSSELVMPTFARIGRVPDLSALGGTSWPYSRATEPVPLIVDNAQPEALSAAVTLLARMSVAAGRSIPIDLTAATATVADRNAIFVAPISQVPPAVLAQVGVAPDNGSTWGAAITADKPSTDATFEEWRERLNGSGWRGQVSSFEEWLKRTFNLSGDTLRLLPARDVPFTPPPGAGLLVAQQLNPAGTGTWTMVTAPNAPMLRGGVETLTRREVWRQLAGRITTLDVSSDKVQAQPVARFTFWRTQPFSLANYRLILANWLSANTLSYSLLLTVMSILLGLATAALLSSLGRRS